MGEILEPLYRAAAEWEKLSHVYEAELGHTVGESARLAAYYRLAELSEDKLLDAPKTLDVMIRALKEYPLDERAGEEAARLAAAVASGWEILANAYADIPLDEQPDIMLYWEGFADPPPHESGKIMVCGHTLQRSDQTRNIGHDV